MSAQEQGSYLILAELSLGLGILGVLEARVLLLVRHCSIVLLGVLLPLVPVGGLLLWRHGIVLLLRHLPALLARMRMSGSDEACHSVRVQRTLCCVTTSMLTDACVSSGFTQSESVHPLCFLAYVTMQAIHISRSTVQLSTHCFGR